MLYYIPSWLQKRIIMLEDVNESLNEGDVRREMSYFGIIDKVQFLIDKRIEYVFVTFRTPEEANAAFSGCSRLPVAALRRPLLGRYDPPIQYLQELKEYTHGSSSKPRHTHSNALNLPEEPETRPQASHAHPPLTSVEPRSDSMELPPQEVALPTRAEVSAIFSAPPSDPVDLLHRIQPGPGDDSFAASGRAGTSQPAVHLVDRINVPPDTPSLLQRVQGNVASAPTVDNSSSHQTLLVDRLSPKKPSTLEQVDDTPIRRISRSSFLMGTSDEEMTEEDMLKSLSTRFKDRLALYEKTLTEERERHKRAEENLRQQLEEKDKVIVALRNKQSRQTQGPHKAIGTPDDMPLEDGEVEEELTTQASLAGVIAPGSQIAAVWPSLLEAFRHLNEITSIAPLDGPSQRDLEEPMRKKRKLDET